MHLPTTKLSRPNRIAGSTGFALAAALCLSSVPVLRAQNEASPSTTPSNDQVIELSEFTVSGTQDKGYMPTNSISATRIQVPIKDLPFSVSAFTEQFISDIGAKELRDIARFAPSTTNSSREFGQGNTRFSIRGFDTDPQRDGVATSAGYIDSSVIQRLEIVKGPASLLYGQLAPGGVINYITKRPDRKASASLNLQVGSWNYRRAEVDYNQPLVPDKLLFRFVGTYENDFEYVDLHKGHTQVIFPELTWNINDSTSMTVEYQGFKRFDAPQAMMRQNIHVPLTGKTQAGVPYMGIDPVTGQPAKFPVDYFGPYALSDLRSNTSEPSDFTNAIYDTVSLELTKKFLDNWTARAVFVYDASNVKREQHGLGDVIVDVPPSEVANLSTDPAVYLKQIQQYVDLKTQGAISLRRVQYGFGHGHNRTFQLDLAGNYKFNNLTWRPVFGYYYNDFNTVSETDTLPTAQWGANWNVLDPSTWTYNAPARSAFPRSNQGWGGGNNTAVYTVQQVSAFQDRLQAVGGVRWSRGVADANPISKTPEFTINKTTPQVGIGYKIRPDLMVYAAYSESFQANNRLLRDHSATATIPAKPYLGSGEEIGLKTDFAGGRLSATLSAFTNKNKNYIFTFNETINGQTVSTDYQGNTVSTDGVELELVATPLDNWQIYFSASYNNPRYTKITSPSVEYLSGTQPESTAKKLANLWTRYTFESGVLKHVWLAGGFNYTGQKVMISNNPFLDWPNRTVWNAVVGYDWKWLDHDMSGSLAWDNLTNEDDTPSVRSRGLPPRVILSVTAKM